MSMNFLYFSLTNLSISGCKSTPFLLSGKYFEKKIFFSLSIYHFPVFQGGQRYDFIYILQLFYYRKF
jgi:hypothetical protein